MIDYFLLFFGSSAASILSLGALIALASLTAYLYRTRFSEKEQENPARTLKTSFSMRSCVDNYALNRPVNLVHHYTVSKGDEKGFFDTRQIIIHCEIIEEMAKIFQLRLALRNFSLPKIEFSEGSVKHGIKHYGWEASFKDESMLIILGKSLGKRVDCATMCILEHKTERVLNSIILLDGFITQITKLQVVCHVLSEKLVHSTLPIMNLYKVEQLSFEYEQVDASCDVRIFVGVAKFVRALRIHQKPGNWALRDVHGDSRIDWASTILAIFQIGTVDKLWIASQMYPEYLAINNAILVMLCLPSVGKKVWFEAHYVDSENELVGIRSDHIVKFDKEQRPPGCSTDTYTLSIKHVMRLNEKFEIHRMT